MEELTSNRLSRVRRHDAGTSTSAHTSAADRNSTWLRAGRLLGAQLGASDISPLLVLFANFLANVHPLPSRTAALATATTAMPAFAPLDELMSTSGAGGSWGRCPPAQLHAPRLDCCDRYSQQVLHGTCTRGLNGREQDFGLREEWYGVVRLYIRGCQYEIS